MRLTTGIAMLVFHGCGGATSATQHEAQVEVVHPGATVGESVVAEQTAPTTEAVRPRRAFGAAERFADLVAAAQALSTQGQGDSEAGCLFARAPNAFQFEADLLPAVRPLPEPPADLGSGLMRERGRIRALSHWGQRGADDHELALVGFTTTAAEAARAPVSAVVLTAKGVFVRHGNRDATDADGPLPVEAVVTRLGAAAGHVLYVTAERDTPIEDLHGLLAQLPFDRPVALAVALTPGTRLPEPPPRGEAGDWVCPDGLPALPRGAPRGTLDTAAITRALAPLREDGARCLASAAGPALAGGKLTLALRVGAPGSVDAACAVETAIADPALLRCMVESARTVAFPAPAGGGSVDLHLPLDLAPIGFAAQRPVCF